jgi:hypothetical protein
MELDLEPGESLARPSSVSTMVAFYNVVFLARGVVVVASSRPARRKPGLLLRERRMMEVHLSFPPWWHRPV